MSGAPRSALVTGSTGFLGSVLVRRLLAEDVAVTCLVRSQSISKAIHFAGDPRVRVVEFQGTDFVPSLGGISADVVFNLASYGVRDTDRDADQLIAGNLSILIGLLRATADWPLKRFVHVGSCSEYGFPAREGALVAETHPIQPRSLYGAAKAASVLCGNAWAYSLDVPFVTLRLFGVYGPSEGPHRLVPYVISRLLNDESVDLTSGEQVRDLLYEDDVAAAFLTAAKAEGIKSGEVYNVCSSRPARIREVVEFVADALAKPRDLLHWGERPYRADEPMWLVGDNRHFRQATTTWSPTVSLHDGLRRVIENARDIARSGERVYGL
jgi:UDP-glucose 4-epimerase